MVNRPATRRADPTHPHTMKATARRIRRLEREDARWHGRWESEQYGVIENGRMVVPQAPFIHTADGEIHV